ncbi:proton-coupled amino acid transporter-like protein pathetic [Bacillus rossius redtenbacheri]|uniref:proton-coupled amino acid transporter-like protein pathetic n=1 Tax=Bacillus rossius redtenbacheri TaxID=93214 RepID=UPI002FDD8BC0
MEPEVSNDPEAGDGGEDSEPFDPFASRKGRHLTTDFETLTHILKASIGTGILGMPMAFKNVGLTMGVLATIVVGVVCAHTSNILVESAHVLYHKLGVSSLTYPDVGENAFLHGPQWAKKYSQAARSTIIIGLFFTYFGTCSVYTVIIAYNFQQVIEHYSKAEMDPRVYIAALFIPLVILCGIPNLKLLAPVSLVANVFMGVALLITGYYLVTNIPPISERYQFLPITGMPVYLGITIFAVQAIGVVMPLENNMKTPKSLLGLTGILSTGTAGIALVYILIGFLGYLRYGDEVEGSITLNLPGKDVKAQVVKVFIGLGIFLTYGLQFFVTLEIAWVGIKDKFPNNQIIAEYILRTILVVITVVLAVAVPTIGPFMGLVGAVCFSLVGIIVPPVIEVVTFWDEGLGYAYYRIWKNSIIIIFGAIAMLSGSYVNILDIIDMYNKL